MERQYIVEMTITVDDKELSPDKTVDDLVLDNLEKAPFQVDTIAVMMVHYLIHQISYKN